MSDESHVQKQVRLLLETQGRKTADMIRHSLPAGVGFALFIFDFGAQDSPGRNAAFYLSNADRGDVARFVIDWAKREGVEPLELGQLRELRDAVVEMRRHQRDYFAGRKEALGPSKALEKKVDRLLEELGGTNPQGRLL